jgi:hypothetical protein
VGAGAWRLVDPAPRSGVVAKAFGPGAWLLDSGAPDIPAAGYLQIDRQVRGGMTVAKVAEDWGVSTQRVEEILNRVGPPEPDLAPSPPSLAAGHLHSDFAGRWEWTFGERRQPPDLLVDFTHPPPWPWTVLGADGPLAGERRGDDPPEQLDTPGFGQYPNGSDPDEPFGVVLWGPTSSSSTTWPRSPSSATCGVPALRAGS